MTKDEPSEALWRDGAASMDEMRQELLGLPVTWLDVPVLVERPDVPAD